MYGIRYIRFDIPIHSASHSLPGAAILELLESYTYLGNGKSYGNLTTYILSMEFKKGYTIEDYTYHDIIEIIKIIEHSGQTYIVRAVLKGPLPKILEQEEGAWITTPSFANHNGLVFTIYGIKDSLRRVSNQIRKLIELGFKIKMTKDPHERNLQRLRLPTRRTQIIHEAIRQGYYERPRRCSQRDLATMMGVTQGNIAEHLQLAEAKIITTWRDDFKI